MRVRVTGDTSEAGDLSACVSCYGALDPCLFLPLRRGGSVDLVVTGGDRRTLRQDAKVADCGSWVVTERHVRHSGTQHGGGRSRVPPRAARGWMSPRLGRRSRKAQRWSRMRHPLKSLRSPRSSLSSLSCPALAAPSTSQAEIVLYKSLIGIKRHRRRPEFDPPASPLPCRPPPQTTPCSSWGSPVLACLFAARSGPHLDMCMAWIMHHTLTCCCS